VNLPCPVNDLIPQKGKMSFAQKLIDPKSDNFESITVIDKGAFFLDDRGQLANSALVEYINQLNAAVQGYNGKLNDRPVQNGLFVGLREAQFLQPVYVGDYLTLKGKVTETISQVSFVKGAVYRGPEKIAELITKLYEAKDQAEFNSLTNLKENFKIKGGNYLNKSTPPAYLISGLRRRLYTYIQALRIDNESIFFEITCPEDFDAFDGHFPGNPVLPGIVLLEIAQLALELFIEKPMTLKMINKMKISGIVLPYQVITGNIKIGRDSGGRTPFSAIFKGVNEREVSRFNGYGAEGKG